MAQDTYAEEYHRAFLTITLVETFTFCGIPDYHIGGLSLIPALLASMEALDLNDSSVQLEKVLNLVQLTHDHSIPFVLQPILPAFFIGWPRANPSATH